MLDKSLYSPEARRRIEAVVKEIEAETSAEIVVSVRPTSGSYLAADLISAGIGATALLCLFLYGPDPYEYTFLPLELAATALAFGLLSRFFDPLRRLLTLRRSLDENAERAARSLFVERGIARTKARTGVLVVVSTFERRAVVVADDGVDPAAIADATRALDAAVKRVSSLDAFAPALRAFGPALARALPRRADDVNELPDAVTT